MHQSCVYKLWYFKNRNSWEEKTFQKKKFRMGKEDELHQSLRATDRWLARPGRAAAKKLEIEIYIDSSVCLFVTYNYYIGLLISNY
jgi:hypothetical protein